MADGEGKGATARPAGNAATEGKQSRGSAGKRRESTGKAQGKREASNGSGKRKGARIRPRPRDELRVAAASSRADLVSQLTPRFGEYYG